MNDSNKDGNSNGEQAMAMTNMESRKPRHYVAMGMIHERINRMQDDLLNSMLGKNVSLARQNENIDILSDLKDSMKLLEGHELPRTVTEEGLKELIDAVEYNRPMINSSFITCYIRLKNGFVVTGESCPVDPSRFDVKVGSDLAYKKAFEKLWMLEGYLLTVKRHEKYAQR